MLATTAQSKSLFEYDFNGVNSAQHLFPTTSEGWTNRQITKSRNALEIVPDSDLGQNVLAIHAISSSSSSDVSKASLIREGFRVGEGDRIVVEAQMKFEKAPQIGGVYFMDLECQDCWPKDSPHANKSPGIRLAFADNKGTLAIDRGKIGYRKEPLQSGRSQFGKIPTNEWISIRWVIDLSQHQNSGRAQVFVNDIKAMDAKGITLPNGEHFEKIGVPLTSSTYNYLEIGATANQSKRTQKIHISHVKISLD